MTEFEKMRAGQLYRSGDPALLALRLKARELTARLSQLPPGSWEQADQILRELLGQAGTDCWFEPPFFCDYGLNISVGDRFYANFGCVLLDCAPITIGNDVMLAPQVKLLTATHPLVAAERNSGIEYARPITLGDNVWLGGGVIVNPGVTIGANTVVGSGSVVTKDLPSGVIAVGNPCRPLRPITEADRICPETF